MKTEDYKDGKPIIIVPLSEEDGNITLYNACELLQNGKYIKPKVAKQKFIKENESKVINKTFFQRKVRGKEVTFEVRNKLEKYHWKRVVAAFLLGPDWQFRDWPVQEKPVILFLKGKKNVKLIVRAFYLKYKDLPAHKNIANWNVKILQINREKRYLDYEVQAEFWQELEHFLATPRVKS